MTKKGISVPSYMAKLPENRIIMGRKRESIWRYARNGNSEGKIHRFALQRVGRVGGSAAFGRRQAWVKG